MNYEIDKTQFFFAVLIIGSAILGFKMAFIIQLLLLFVYQNYIKK